MLEDQVIDFLQAIELGDGLACEDIVCPEEIDLQRPLFLERTEISRLDDPIGVVLPKFLPEEVVVGSGDRRSEALLIAVVELVELAGK